AGGALEGEIGVRPDVVRVRTEVDLQRAHRGRGNHVLRNVAFRVERETQLDVGRRVGADGMEMELEIDLRSGFDQTAGSLRKHVALLSNRVLVEKDSLFSDAKRRVSAVQLSAAAARTHRLDERRPDMVDDGESLRRNDLNALDVAILDQARIR